MDFSIVFSVTAGILQLVGYWIYWRAVCDKRVEANSASWFIWAYGSVINLATYMIMSQDIVKDILPIACAVACVAIFWAMVKRDGLGKLDRTDYLVIGIDVMVTFVWFLVGATEANVSLQFGEAIGFIPLVRAVWRGVSKEVKLPWAIWTFAYALMFVTVAMRWQKWEDALYPAVAFVLNAVVWSVVWFKNKKK